MGERETILNELDFCLNVGRCTECEYSKGRMFATCRHIAEDTYKLLKEQEPAEAPLDAFKIMREMEEKDMPTTSAGGGKNDDARFRGICLKYTMPLELANKETVKRVIKSAFTHRNFIAEGLFGRHEKPQAYVLARSLEVLQTYLATQSIPKMIRWANSED